MVYNPMQKAFRDGETTIDLSDYLKPPEKGKPPIMLYKIVLGFPLRNYFIEKVKAPLQRAIESMADQHIKLRKGGVAIDATPLAKVIKMATAMMPEATKENSASTNAEVIIDVIDNFFKYTNIKKAMFEESFKVLKFELAHDKFYDEAFQILIEEIIKKILAGEWKVREETPHSLFWNNFTPKGGKYSIISILQNKKSMENLLGDKWRLSNECNPRM